MYILSRYKDPLDSTSGINEEFSLIRHAFWNGAPDNLSLGNWLRQKGLMVVTNIPEHDAREEGRDGWLEDYMVLEIHFPSELDFLSFKLKYL